MNIHSTTPPVNPSLEALKAARAASTARGLAKGLSEAAIKAEQAPINEAFNADKDRSTPERRSYYTGQFAALWPITRLTTEEVIERVEVGTPDEFKTLPNEKMAEAFAEQLTGSRDGVFRLRFIHDSDKTNHRSFEIEGTIPALWPQVRECQHEGYGVFYFVNAITPRLERFARDQDVTACRAFATDHDGGLPEDFEWHVNPTLIVKTSRVPVGGKDVQKGQALWLADIPLSGFKAGQQRLAAHYGTDKSISNRARVLRLPGSYHLKDPTRPQLVTFEVTGERCIPEAILNGVAELPASAPRSLSGQPIGEKVLREAAAYVDPFTGRPEWFLNLLALRAANIVGDDASGTIARQVMHDWSSGKLDTGNRFKDTNGVYTGPEAIDAVFETTKSEGATTVATFIGSAQANGFKGNPFSDGKSSSETFKEVLRADRSDPNSAADDGQMIRCNDAAELLTHEPKPLREIIPGLVERGIATMLAGAGSTHKSRTVLHWCAAVHTGIAIYGRPVIPATSIYLDYENGEDEMCRRLHMIQKRLNLPALNGFKIFDLKKHTSVLANVTPEGIAETKWADWLGNYLCKIKGHKFIAADSCYNILRFTGQSKIDETLVKEAINFLDNFCAATDSTMVFLWHPSYSGQDRGDASGWSVAWHNAPRGRNSLTKARTAKGNKVIPNSFTLKVEKRNNGPEGEEFPLYWSNGLLLPKSQIEIQQVATLKLEASVRMAIKAAANETPIKQRGEIEEWRLDEVERECGQRLSVREIKEELAHALEMKRLRYIKGGGHRTAGYYAWDDPGVDPSERRVADLIQAGQKNGSQVIDDPGPIPFDT